MDPRIDKTIKALIPPLLPEEYSGLENSMLSDGCRDALIVWAGKGILVDGHNRFEICKKHNIKFKTVEKQFKNREEVDDWIDANQLARRNLTPDQMRLLRGRRYNRLKTKGHGSKTAGQNDTQNIQTADILADQHGVSPATIKRDAKAAELLEKYPEEMESVIKGDESLKKTIKKIKKDENDTLLKKAHGEISEEKKKSIKEVCDIRHCSFEELLTTIKPDAIITDPPYPFEYLNLYEKLAMLSKDIPVVAVMCGQSYLPEIISMMTKHLNYRWMFCYLTPGGQSVQQWPSKINTFWKPVLIFGESTKWSGDVVKSSTNDNDKRFHEWGQSESGMKELINKLTNPGDLICDPFLGGGTTAVAALATGRKFIGCDDDIKCVNTSLERCEVYSA